MSVDQLITTLPSELRNNSAAKACLEAGLTPSDILYANAKGIPLWEYRECYKAGFSRDRICAAFDSGWSLYWYSKLPATGVADRQIEGFASDEPKLASYASVRGAGATHRQALHYMRNRWDALRYRDYRDRLPCLTHEEASFMASYTTTAFEPYRAVRSGSPVVHREAISFLTRTKRILNRQRYGSYSDSLNDPELVRRANSYASLRMKGASPQDAYKAVNGDILRELRRRSRPYGPRY